MAKRIKILSSVYIGPKYVRAGEILHAKLFVESGRVLALGVILDDCVSYEIL